MGVVKQTNDSVETFFGQWMSKNEKIFQQEITDKKIGDSEQLIKSFHYEIIKLADGYLKGEHSFMTRGRFVDMGVGRGHPASGIGSRGDKGSWSRGRSGRIPKKWYSPALYGRLNDLMGAVGARISEQAVANIKTTLLRP